MTEFLHHAVRLRSLDHDHVLSLAGIVLEDRVPLAVSQYTKYGDLKNFLMEVRKKPEVSVSGGSRGRVAGLGLVLGPGSGSRSGVGRAPGLGGYTQHLTPP